MRKGRTATQLDNKGGFSLSEAYMDLLNLDNESNR